MGQLSLHQFLTIFSWFGLATLIFFMALIARFYERLSGQRTYYQLFIGPMLAFTVATVRFASLDEITGDDWGDGALLIAGLILAALCIHIYRHMTSGR
ncbi:MAG TPA: hypothetical protein VHP83_05785 [Aggregatilineaceae bacterium]|nr:hypothetical protein [Aggregatilineaceae bacterium]